MQINRRVNYNPLLEIELLKVNDKEEYYVSNPYNENIKYPNIEKNIDWFAKIYNEGEINTDNPFEDLDTVESELKEFESLKSRNILPIEIKSKHISKMTYSDIKDITSEYSEKMTITQALKVDKSIKQEELSNVKAPFKVIKVTDPYTATQLASPSHLKWCVRYIDHAKDYLIESKGALFFVYKDDKEFALLSFGGGQKNHGELMNPKDNRLSRMEMQEIKDHWSQVTEYLRVFNIHDYDADFNYIIKGINKEISKNKNKLYPESVTFKFSDVVRYEDSNIVRYIKSKGQDVASIESQISYSLIRHINDIKEEDFKGLFIDFLKSKILKLLEVAEGNHKYKQSITIEKGEIKVNFDYNDLYSPSSEERSKDVNSDIEKLLDSGVNDPKLLYKKRVEFNYSKVKDIIETKIHIKKYYKKQKINSFLLLVMKNLNLNIKNIKVEFLNMNH